MIFINSVMINHLKHYGKRCKGNSSSNFVRGGSSLLDMVN